MTASVRLVAALGFLLVLLVVSSFRLWRDSSVPRQRRLIVILVVVDLVLMLYFGTSDRWDDALQIPTIAIGAVLLMAALWLLPGAYREFRARRRH